MGDAERAFKAAKIIAPTSFIPVTLFLEHYALVIATILPDGHGVIKELLETLDELKANKRHINAQAESNKKFASQIILTVQIQMNKFAWLVERGHRTNYPTFSTIVLAVMTDQFLPPPLSAKLEQ